MLFHLALFLILLTFNPICCSLLITQKVVETALEEEKDDDDGDQEKEEDEAEANDDQEEEKDYCVESTGPASSTDKGSKWVSQTENESKK